MAIQFDPNALRMFSGVNFGDDDAGFAGRSATPAG
jgi:hypothetical protein